MTAKESLSRALVISGKLDKKRQLLEALHDLAERASAPNITGMPRGTDVSKPVENAVMRITEAEDDVAAMEDKLSQAKAEIAGIIQILDNPLQIKLLAMRFLSFMDWDAVAKELGYSRRHVFRLRDEAFEKLGTHAPANDTPLSSCVTERPVL